MKFFLIFFLFIDSALFGVLSVGEVNAILKDRFNPTTQTPYAFTPKVDVVSGSYAEEENDLVVAGIEPLSFRRFYLSSSPYDPRFGNWNLNPESFAAANFELGDSDQFVSCGERDGSIHSFENKQLTNNSFQVTGSYVFDISKHKNSIGQQGNVHPLNTKINFRRNHGATFAYEGEIRDGSGRTRFFKTQQFNWITTRIIPVEVTYTINNRSKRRVGEMGIPPKSWTPYQLLIDEERLPNGNVLRYNYVQWKDEQIYPQFRVLKSITAYNSSKNKIIGSFEIDYSKQTKRVIGSDNRVVNIGFAGHPSCLVAIVSSFSPNTCYQYSGSDLIQILRPDGRLFRTEYEPSKKVRAQFAPVGPKGEMCPISRYGYYDYDRVTLVYDGENNKTGYHYDENKRIIAIASYQNENRCKVEHFQWDSATGTLLIKSIEDGRDNLFFKQTFGYDKNHNPIKETRGDNNQTYTLYRSFSDNGFNLKEREWDDEGKTVCYSYVPNTNLLASELVYEENRIRKRTFHTYDDCAVLVKTIVDDGISENPNDLRNVTMRKIIEVTPKQQIPCFGLPEEVREKTIDERGNEILLGKVRYTYHPTGKVLREEHFDAYSAHRYTIQNEYNEKELLIATTDGLENKTTFSYDANFNLIAQFGPGPGMHKEWDFDLANRQTQEKEWLGDGSILVKQKKYDKASRIIATLDECGFETRYEYDPLGRVITIRYPDGTIERKVYDPLGNVILEVDGKGYETRRKYNFRSQPLSISYSDGTHELYTYNPNGTIKSHTDKNGVKTLYTYDIFNNPTRIETLSSSDKLLKVSTATYSPFHKLSEIDSEGNKTTFKYDFAGRKIGEERGGKQTRYSYDLMGRLTETRMGDALYEQVYDAQGQLIEKNKKNLSDQLLEHEKYAYDKAGNQTHIIRSQGVTETRFDTRGQPLLKIDPLGRTTQYLYSYTGGVVKTEIDPKGIQTIHKYDSRQNEIESLKKTDHEIQKVERRFDTNQNLIEETHFVFDGSRLIDKIIYSWTYGPNNRLEKLIEAGQKETKYQYDSQGRLSTKIKPDGLKLNHEYDELGRLTRYFSKDFSYHYAYDKNDRVLFVDDGNSKTSRLYDPLGNVIEERLGNGILLRYDFDTEGRREKTHLPDETTIDYAYSANRIRTITRKGQTHTYLERDFDGYLSKAELPYRLGTISIERDPLSRWKQFTSRYYSSIFDKNAYDLSDNLSHYQFVDSIGSKICSYSYDDLNQLIEENEHTYHFDSLYNRLKKDEFVHQVNQLSQITNDGITNYIYDANGNLMFDGKTRYDYDTLDRLISIQHAETRIDVTYDPFHRRLSKTVFTGNKVDRQLFIYDDNLEIGSTDAQGKIQELRILGEGLGAEIGASLFIEIGEKTYIPIHDHRGCVVTLIDPENKAVAETLRYSAFGEELTSTRLSPWRFASKRVDPETGWVYFGRRYYSPPLGRWITPDPQGFEDGPNLYAYLHNSPLTDYDLYGLWSWRNAFSYLQSGFEEAFPLTHYSAQRNNYFMGIPAAIFEVGAWTAVGIERTAFSLGQKAINQITRTALQRAETTAAMRAFGRTTSKVTSQAIEKNIIPRASRTAQKTLSRQTFKEGAEQLAKKKGRNILKPDVEAAGAHSVFRRDPITGKITHYETYRPQTNPYDPKPWESVLRFDNPIDPHYHFNKTLNDRIYTPHVHDPYYPGYIRSALPGEIPSL